MFLIFILRHWQFFSSWLLCSVGHILVEPLWISLNSSPVSNHVAHCRVNRWREWLQNRGKKISLLAEIKMNGCCTDAHILPSFFSLEMSSFRTCIVVCKLLSTNADCCQVYFSLSLLSPCEGEWRFSMCSEKCIVFFLGGLSISGQCLIDWVIVTPNCLIARSRNLYFNYYLISI